MLKFFRLPFATSGDKTAIPDAVDTNGNVSYTQGYGFDYQRQKTDPAAKNIERDKMNQVFFDITTAIAEIQAQGVPDFITTALNGGAAYSYAQYAVVRYSGELYISLVAANTALPTDPASWAPFSAILKGLGVTPPQFDNDTSLATTAFVQANGLHFSGGVLSILANTTLTSAQAGGIFQVSAAVTITMPPIASVPNGASYTFQFNAFSGTLKGSGTESIVSAGPGTNTQTYFTGETVTLVAIGGFWIAVANGVGTSAFSAMSSLAASGYQKLPSGLIIQWGSASSSASADVPVNFPIAFPNGIHSLQISSVAGTPASYAATITGIPSLSGFAFGAYATSTAARVATTCYWFAIGH